MGAPGDEGDSSSSEDEDAALEREIREGLLRDLQEGSDDDEMRDIFSPLPTPPSSEDGGDGHDEEDRPPRIHAGHVGLDKVMDTEPGLTAKNLESDEVRFKVVDWLSGAATAFLASSLLLGVWCMLYGVA